MIFENLKLDYLYQTFSPFKESEISNIVRLIGPSRISECIKFKCYGNASFNEEDTKHQFMTVMELGGFERKNSNVIVFEVTDEDCKSVYTELFLYHNDAVRQPSYGLISYNSDTGKVTHKIQIDHDPSDLLIALSKATLYMRQPKA